ncbi:MAG: hypothetical protein BWY75_01030 [bacterium ADurb.Bin425]|nr:MAG: hypothetical protein BWY75_01030 [bacterium ADurb.Bin425]
MCLYYGNRSRVDLCSPCTGESIYTQKTERIINERRFAYCPYQVSLQIFKSAHVIDDLIRYFAVHHQGIYSQIPPQNILLNSIRIACKVQNDAFLQHHPGDIKLVVEKDKMTGKFLRNFSGKFNSTTIDGKIEIQISSTGSVLRQVDGISYRSANQIGFTSFFSCPLKDRCNLWTGKRTHPVQKTHLFVNQRHSKLIWLSLHETDFGL